MIQVETRHEERDGELMKSIQTRIFEDIIENKIPLDEALVVWKLAVMAWKEYEGKQKPDGGDS